MAIYCYKKAIPSSFPRSNFQILHWVFVFLGLILVGNALAPIFLYQLGSNRFQEQVIITPVESYFVDYNKPSSWFPAAAEPPPQQSKITHYNLSVSKLKIEKAVVQIGGEDLSESLIQYPGTALPGQYGTTVIFGHSVLPQFFNPQKYKTIFSTLPTLKEGDEVLIDFDGIVYRYQVTQMVEVAPDDVSVLEQRYDGEYLNLITCVPPGTYLRRLVVRAKLISH